MYVLFVLVLVFGQTEDAALRSLMLFLDRHMHVLGLSELRLPRHRGGTARVRDLHVDRLRGGGWDEVYGHTGASRSSFNIARCFRRAAGEDVCRMGLALGVLSLRIRRVVVVGGL